MNRPSRDLVNVDDLIRRVSVEDVLRFYGVASDSVQRVGSEIRSRCFLNCSKTEPTGDRALAIKADDDAKRWCCHRYECEHRRGGNLVGLIDLIKPGEHMNGRPRGQRFTAILDDLKQLAGGNPLSTAPVAPQSARPPIAEPPKLNIPLEESDNERARAVVDLHEKFIVDPLAMSPAAASYFRRRPYLTPEVCARWKIGYLPFDSGGSATGGSMRGKIVYPIHDELGHVLTYFARDPQHEEKLAAFKASDRSGREPEKFHFVRNFHRSLELFGQHQLIDEAVRELIQSLRYVLLVEGPNDAIRLGALGVPAFAVCSNRITDAQADKVAAWCRELDVSAGVMFDCDTEGHAGAEQAVVKLAERCPVRLVWSRSMFDGRFKERQPEDLTLQEWRSLGVCVAPRALQAGR